MYFLTLFACILVFAKTVWLGRDMRIPARLISNGKTYVESWSMTQGDTHRYWMQLMQGNLHSNYQVLDVIYPETALEISAALPKVINGKCNYYGDEINNEHCDQLCLSIEPIKPLKGECMNNVCFCLFHTPADTHVRTYISLKAAVSLASLATEDLIKASRIDGVQDAIRVQTPESDEVSKDSDLGSPLSPRSPDQSGIEYMDSNDSDTPTVISCGGLSPPRELRQHCTETNAVADCLPAETSEVQCHDGDELITKEQCHSRCLQTGEIIALNVQEGFCEDDKCHCKFTNEDGSCGKAKLTSLEKRKPKKSKLRVPPLRFDLDEFICNEVIRHDISFL